METATARTPGVHANRLAYIEEAQAPAIASVEDYAAATHVAAHRHSRSQLLFPASGMVSVWASDGHWLVPTGQALWIPAGTVHAVDMIGSVQMVSAHVLPDALSDLPTHLHVAALSPLLRQLVIELGLLDKHGGAREDIRRRHITGAILEELLRLEQLPLGLPLPASAHLLKLCQAYLEDPGGPTRIDDWATAAGMSRRNFTRTFRAETGLGLSAWRQQACLMAALPKLAAGQSVTATAFDLGYDSVPAFTTMFTRMLGLSPRAYVRSMSEKS